MPCNSSVLKGGTGPPTENGVARRIAGRTAPAWAAHFNRHAGDLKSSWAPHSGQQGMPTFSTTAVWPAADQIAAPAAAGNSATEIAIRAARTMRMTTMRTNYPSTIAGGQP